MTEPIRASLTVPVEVGGVVHVRYAVTRFHMEGGVMVIDETRVLGTTGPHACADPSSCSEPYWVPGDATAWHAGSVGPGHAGMNDDDGEPSADG